MLFNSYAFIFLFLVPLLAVARYINPKYLFGYIILASVIFYAQWDLLHLSLLSTSIVANYFFSKRLSSKYKKPILALAVTLNLMPLIFFKYSFFLSLSTHTYTLPLAISFYTFQQIAFLVDVYKEKIKDTTLREYLFFVLFFPHLIAGPILHYNELMPQAKKIFLSLESVLAGTVIFSIGLAKKIILADSLYPIANQGFDLVQNATLNSLHGILLVLLHLKTAFLPKMPTLFKPLSIFVTFITVTLLWVFFRSPSFDMALKYYEILFDFSSLSFTTVQFLLQKGIYHNFFVDTKLFILMLSLMVVWLLPFNSNYFYDKKPTKATLFIAALLLMTSLKTLASTPSNSFLYFNF